MLFCVLHCRMCRHKGIGMNKPKKTKVEVIKYDRVKVRTPRPATSARGLS